MSAAKNTKTSGSDYIGPVIEDTAQKERELCSFLMFCFAYSMNHFNWQAHIATSSQEQLFGVPKFVCWDDALAALELQKSKMSHPPISMFSRTTKAFQVFINASQYPFVAVLFHWDENEMFILMHHARHSFKKFGKFLTQSRRKPQMFYSLEKVSMLPFLLILFLLFFIKHCNLHS